jgi:hypothetical protein
MYNKIANKIKLLAYLRLYYTGLTESIMQRPV